jgi:hypothetical protein
LSEAAWRFLQPGPEAWGGVQPSRASCIGRGATRQGLRPTTG